MNSRHLIYIIIICGLPFQFSFELNFYGAAQSQIEKDWDYSKLSKYQIEIHGKMTTYVSTICSILSIFLSYKMKKRRLPISIMYLASGVIWIFHMVIGKDDYALVLILKALCGVLLGFFHSVHISYMMHFVEKENLAFYGCLVQFSMFCSLVLVNILVYAVNWKLICLFISIQSFLFAGLIWIVPEVHVIPKKASNTYVYKKPHLRNVIVMMAIMWLQCFSGIGFMIDNCARLMSDVGINIDTKLQSALTNFIGCLSTFIAAFIMDILGVRFMWALSAFGLVASLIIYAITLKVNCPKWLGCFSVFLYFLFFGLGEGPIPWLLCGVIFPESIMVETGGINCFMNRFLDCWFGYILTEITTATGEFGGVLFNACCSLVAGLFGLMFIPSFQKTHPDNTTVL